MKKRFGLALFASAAFAACANEASSPSEQDPSFKAIEDNVIGGFASAGYDAVGTVGIVYEGKYYMLCSATLVAPKVVLSAKHCAIFLDDGSTPAHLVGLPLLSQYDMAFAIGNAVQPTEQYEIVDVLTTPQATDGFVGLGRDVSTFLLKDAVTTVKTIPFATQPVSTDLVGKKAVVIGYGSQTNLQDITGELDGTRKVGQATVANFSGNVSEIVFGSFEKYCSDYLGLYYGKEEVDSCLAEESCAAMLRDWYEAPLLEGYELWASKQAGDAITCHGDSGGPLLKKVQSAADAPASLQILGVVSGGFGSSELACDYGTVYATLGAETQAMLSEAVAWVDPCELSPGVSVAATGECNGTVATRCITAKANEGPRRVSTMDCAELDQTCAIIDGLAGCADAEAPEGGDTGGGAGDEPSTGGNTGSGTTVNGGGTVVTRPTPGLLQTAVERFSIAKARTAVRVNAKLAR